MREGYVTINSVGDAHTAVPVSAVTGGPHVNWKHVDGPLMTWAGHLHWLTLGERLRIWLGWTTVDDVACTRWPKLAALRAIHS